MAHTAQARGCLTQLAIIALALTPTVCSHQFLFLPLSERTHMLVTLKLATVLAERGHGVTFITADCHQAFAQQTAASMAPAGVQLQFVTYSMDCDYHEREKAAARLLSPLGEVAAIYRNVVGRADDLLSDSALMQQLAVLAPQTDLLVSDIFSFGMLLAAKLDLQHVDLDVGTAGSLWEPVLYGAEAAPSYIPAVGTFFPTDGMQLWQRAANAVMTTTIRALIRAAFWSPSWSLQQIVAKHSIPIKWPYTRAMMLLVNSNFAIEPPRAIPPNVQYIGPILPSTAKPLPADLEAFVNGSSTGASSGVVLVSFGGTLQAPLAASQTLVAVMGAMPAVRFVWKLSAADQAALAESTRIKHMSNVLMSEWLPQNDLLGHPNTQAFITQGGYLSMAEAAYHGVPVLGLPFIPGQGELIQFAADQGRAICLHASSLAAGKVTAVVQALQTLLTNSSYSIAAQVVSRRLQAPQRHYQDVAADWVEYAAAVKDDGPFLHPAKLWQRWYQQAMLDVALLLAAAAGLLLLFVQLVLRQAAQLLLPSHSSVRLPMGLHGSGKHQGRRPRRSSSCGSSCGDSDPQQTPQKSADAAAKVVLRSAMRTPYSKQKGVVM